MTEEILGLFVDFHERCRTDDAFCSFLGTTPALYVKFEEWYYPYRTQCYWWVRHPSNQYDAIIIFCIQVKLELLCNPWHRYYTVEAEGDTWSPEWKSRGNSDDQAENGWENVNSYVHSVASSDNDSRPLCRSAGKWRSHLEFLEYLMLSNQVVWTR